MRVVIVTAEPYGFYHIRGTLLREFQNATFETYHLIPKISGKSSAPKKYLSVTDDKNIITGSDLVILAGGGINEWLSEIGKIANAESVPVIYLEVAFSRTERMNTFYVPKFEGAFVSDNEAKLSFEFLYKVPSNNIYAVGLPMLDDIPKWSPPKKKLVMVGTHVSSELPDGGRILKEWAEVLQKEKWKIHVALHPREDPKLWKKFKIVNNRTVDVAAKSDVVITYPGTLLRPLGEMNIPVIVPMMEKWLEHRVPYHYLKTAYLIYENDFFNTVHRAYSRIQVLESSPQYQHSKTFIFHVERFLNNT